MCSDLLHIYVLDLPCYTVRAFEINTPQLGDPSQGRNPRNNRIHTECTAEYTAEELTIILPKIVLFTLFTGGMVLDGMTLQRHNFPVPHQNATPRMGTATNCHHVTRIHVKPDA